MADFVAVLKKTLDGLGETTPEIRQKVYAKARATVAAKLAAMNPPPPQAAADRQRKALEDAIAAVEADYEAQEELLLDPIEELESAIASLQPAPAAPLGTAIFKPAAARSEPPPSLAKPEPSKPDPILADSGLPEEEDGAEEEEPPVDRGRRRNSAGILVAIGALALLAGAGYAAWLNREDIAALLDRASPANVATDAEQPAREPLVEEQPAEAAAEGTEQPEGTDQPEEDVAAASPEPTPSDEASTQEPEQVQKFTQRLQPDGSEVDMGRAGDQPAVGEGTSVAAATTQPPLEAPQPSAPAGESSPPSETETQPLVAVGQKAIFYEERTNVAQGSAENGSIVWSLVQESPGGDLPPEPAIRAEATIPGKDLQLRMTIRRNGDPSLPASHIVEMIFLTPENFEGGGIANVLRMALKDSEQSPGNPLIGIPAKIADGFFLIALSDGKAEIEANTTMLRRQSWIDIPIVYRSGRRALITMEKGIPGDKVFDEALKAWQAASSG